MENAILAARQGLEHAEKVNDPYQQQRARMMLGRLFATQKKLAEALENFEAAAATSRSARQEHTDLFQEPLAEALREISKIQRAQGNEDTGDRRGSPVPAS